MIRPFFVLVFFLHLVW